MASPSTFHCLTCLSHFQSGRRHAPVDWFAEIIATSSTHTSGVARNSIFPTMPFQLCASESEMLCASGRYGISIRLSTRTVSVCLPGARLVPNLKFMRRAQRIVRADELAIQPTPAIPSAVVRGIIQSVCPPNPPEYSHRVDTRRRRDNVAAAGSRTAPSPRPRACSSYKSARKNQFRS